MMRAPAGVRPTAPCPLHGVRATDVGTTTHPGARSFQLNMGACPAPASPPSVRHTQPHAASQPRCPSHLSQYGQCFRSQSRTSSIMLVTCITRGPATHHHHHHHRDHAQGLGFGFRGLGFGARRRVVVSRGVEAGRGAVPECKVPVCLCAVAMRTWGGGGVSAGGWAAHEEGGCEMHLAWPRLPGRSGNCAPLGEAPALMPCSSADGAQGGWGAVRRAIPCASRPAGRPTHTPTPAPAPAPARMHAGMSSWAAGCSNVRGTPARAPARRRPTRAPGCRQGLSEGGCATQAHRVRRRLLPWASARSARMQAGSHAGAHAHAHTHKHTQAGRRACTGWAAACSKRLSRASAAHARAFRRTRVPAHARARTHPPEGACHQGPSA